MAGLSPPARPHTIGEEEDNGMEQKEEDTSVGASEEEPQPEDGEPPHLEEAITGEGEQGAHLEEEEGAAGVAGGEEGEEEEEQHAEEVVAGGEEQEAAPEGQQDEAQGGGHHQGEGPPLQALAALAEEVALLRAQIEDGEKTNGVAPQVAEAATGKLQEAAKRRWSKSSTLDPRRLAHLSSRVRRWSSKVSPDVCTVPRTLQFELKFIHIIFLVTVGVMWSTNGWFSQQPVGQSPVQATNTQQLQPAGWWQNTEYSDAYAAYKLSRGPYRRFFDFVDSEVSALWGVATSMVRQQHLGNFATQPQDVFTAPAPIGAPNIFTNGVHHHPHQTPPLQQSALAQHAEKSTLLTLLAVGGMLVGAARTVVGGARAVRGVAQAAATVAAAPAAAVQANNPFHGL